MSVRIVPRGRPYPGEQVSGDGWSISRTGQRHRISLIDGLGHGPAAAEATATALAILERLPDAAPEAAIHACHAALRGTRGAAMTVATIDEGTRLLTIAGIGNIEAVLWRAEKTTRPIAMRGIVGRVIPTVRTFTYPLDGPWLLVMHSDGVSARFELTALPGFPERDLDAMSAALIDSWGRETDDASVIVASSDGLPSPVDG